MLSVAQKFALSGKSRCRTWTFTAVLSIEATVAVVFLEHKENISFKRKINNNRLPGEAILIT